MAEDVKYAMYRIGSSQPLYTSGGYAQISKVSEASPVFRYQWMNPNFKDPNNAWVGRWVGPKRRSALDVNTFIALKLEYLTTTGRTQRGPLRNQTLPVLHKTVEQVGTQLTTHFEWSSE